MGPLVEAVSDNAVRLRSWMLLGVAVVLGSGAILAGWATRPPDQPYARWIDMQELPVVWTAKSEIDGIEPASAFIERETVQGDGTVLIEGWLRVTALPFHMAVSGPTPIRNAAGFSFLRADLPTAEGARAFTMLLEPESDGPIPICLTAVLGGERQRLSTPSCP